MSENYFNIIFDEFDNDLAKSGLPAKKEGRPKGTNHMFLFITIIFA